MIFLTVEPPAPPINFSFIPFNLINIRNTNDFIDIIKVRLILHALHRVHLRGVSSLLCCYHPSVAQDVLMQRPVVLSQFTFALGWLRDLSFSLKLTCWVPWISQVSTTGFLQFVLEQSHKSTYGLKWKSVFFKVISRVISMAEPATEESECFSFLLAPLNFVAYDLVKHISLSMPFIVT